MEGQGVGTRLPKPQPNQQCIVEEDKLPSECVSHSPGFRQHAAQQLADPGSQAVAITGSNFGIPSNKVSNNVTASYVNHASRTVLKIHLCIQALIAMCSRGLECRV